MTSINFLDYIKMRFELPDFRRCCFCCPLRRGIIIFGYLNLVFTILMMSLEAWLDFGYHPSIVTISMYRGVEMHTQLWLHFFLFTLEFIFNVVLLIGAHTKQNRLLRVYYYYGLMTTVASSIIFILVFFNKTLERDWYIDNLAICLAFTSFSSQVYLLLLIRAEMQKLKYQEGNYSYVNHMSEVVLDPPVGAGRNPL